MSRFLITTADERTWKFDRPVLFLGEWCRHYDRRHVWAALDATVAEPYGLGRDEKRRDLARTEAVSRELLVELAAALNLVHGTDHGPRYWQIVLGHWLRRYVDTIFNRHATLEHALARHDIDRTVVIDAPASALVRNDSLAFIYGCNDDQWNHALYARILDSFEPTGISRETLSAEVSTGPAAGAVASPPLLKRAAGRIGRSVLAAACRADDAFIMRSYLPRGTEVALQISLRQCPQFWQSPAVGVTAASPERRQLLRLPLDGRSGFDRCVRDLLPGLLPTCYLEGFGGLVRQCRALPWPSRPRFIFTSNNFDTDEVFKVWCAGQVEQGTPYFAGQHGNNYGTHFYAGNSQWPERSATDAFISWGWSDPATNVVPAFNFKAPNPQPMPHDPGGGLLLVEEGVNHRLTPWDSYYEFGTYQEQQFRFVEALPLEIRRALMVRIHGEHVIHRWCEPRRWAERHPAVRLDTGQVNIQALIAQSRLVVYSYESTGVLENLTGNVPTLCFWPYGLTHLLPEARPHYSQLVEAGIIAESPEQAAAFVSRVWGNVRGWWGSDRVQRARTAFCDQYARPEAHPVTTMRRLLTEQARRAAAPATA